MKLPRDLSGEQLIRHLCKHWEYERVHQVGSHVILQTQQPTPHRVAVPAHTALRIGTLNSILSAVAMHKNVTKEDVLKGI
ncbi:MAG TPA: type II toxin-antitoxin system HicA family toxin [Terracidiphilus sp.]|jgi:predicted RNA binding protein YcfA (HicA-like mRNA interferase family)